MSIARPDGANAGLAGAPYMSEQPFTAASERALHAAMQRLYCDRVRTYAAEMFATPVDIETDDTTQQLVYRTLVEMRRGVTNLRCELYITSSAWLDPRSNYPGSLQGSPFVSAVQMYTYTVANPPVLITTGTEIVRSIGPTVPDLMGGRQAANEREPDLAMRVPMIAFATITPDTSGTREQIVDIYYRDGMAIVTGGIQWVISKVRLHAIHLYEVRLSEL